VKGDIRVLASEGGVLAFLSGVDRRIFDDVYVPLADVFDVVVLTPFDTHRHTHTRTGPTAASGPLS